MVLATARRLLSPRVRRWLPYGLLIVIVMTLVGVHVHRYPVMSPIDELRHLDYLERASHLDFPKLGDKLHQEAMREEACRGVAATPPFYEPPCDSKHFKPNEFRDDGYQNATFHPPTYYLVGGLTSRAAVELGIFDSIVEPARLFSGLLIALGLALTLAAARLAGVRTIPAFAACVVALAAPSVFGSGTVVNPDAGSVLAGAAVMAVALLWERGRAPTWVLVAVGIGATGIKLTNAVAVAIVAAWFLVRAIPPGWTGRVRSRLGLESDGPPVAPAEASTYPRTMLTLGSRRYLVGAGAVVAGALAAAAAWALIDGARATIDASVIPQNQAYAAVGIPNVEQFLNSGFVFAFLPPFTGFQSTFLFTDAWVQDIVYFAPFVFVGAVLMATLRFRRDDRVSVIAAVTVAVLLVGGPAFAVLQFVINDIYNNPSPRYGMSAIPALILVLAGSAVGRVGRVLLTALAVIVVGVMTLAVVA